MPPVFTLPPSFALPEINIIEEIPQALILPHPSTPAAPTQIRRQAKPAAHSSIKYGKMFGI